MLKRYIWSCICNMSGIF